MSANSTWGGGGRPRRIGAGLLAAVGLLLLVSAPAQADRDFASRFTANQPGNISIVGNTLLTCNTAVANCTNAQDGTGTVLNNNNFSMVNVDVDSDGSTTNSSRATLAMPSGATVLWAGLYWFGRSTDSARNTVKLQAPGQAGYTSLTSEISPVDSNGTLFYSALKNVTSTVSTAGNGVYTVADVKAETGTTDRNAGWALVVAYGDATQPPRNLSVFDGLVTVPPSPNTISINGFTTPPSGTVKTSLGVVSQDGDLGSTGDSLSLNSIGISDGANPASNVFNSTITSFGSDLGGRTPNFKNQLGMDADIFKADGILGNQATSATIKLTTAVGGETYLPDVVTFATELYAPVVVPDKTVTNLTHPGGPTQPGDTLRYTLSFQNTGQDAADGYVVTDPIPAGASYKPNTLSIGGGGAKTDASGDDQAEFIGAQSSVRFRLGTGANATTGGSIAASGGTASATFDVTVDSGHSEGDVITNRASSDYRGHTVGTPFVGQLTPPVNTVVHVPDLTLSKQHSPAFIAGGNTTFTLVASNVGTVPTDGSQVTVADTFPSGTGGFDSISNAGGAGWSCNIAGLTLTCTRSDLLPNGQSYPPILVDAQLHNPLDPTVTNVATVSGGGDGNPVNNQATDSSGATAQADVQVTKRTTTPSVANGGQIEWIVDVHNAGPSTAANVTMDDSSLGGSDYDQVAATPTQGTCDTSVSCDLGSIVPGGTATITIRARVLANDTTLNNTASATSTTTDPDTTNNSGQASAVVANTADVRIVKTGGPAEPAVNDSYSYTLQINNDGPGDATDLVLTDQLPAKLANPAITAAGWSCNAPGTGGVLTCTRASLVNGGSSTITIDGTIAGPDGGTFQNDAAVSTGSTDPNQGNNTSSKTELATPAADLGVTKTFSQTTPADPGDTVTFDLVVTNHGPSTAVNAVLDDTVPAGLTVTAVDDPDCVFPANAVHCDFGDLVDGAVRTVTVTATVNTPADPVQGDTITNVVTTDSDTFDQDSSNDTDRDRLTVTPSADIGLSKTVSPGQVAVGDNVVFTLFASNAGPSQAVGVSVSDTLPAGLSFVSASAGCSGTTVVTCAPPGGTLNSGGNATFTITATVTAALAGQRVSNTASVTTTSPHDPDPTNNTSTSEFGVDPRADLELVKTAGDPNPAIDADDTFTLEVTNHGPNAAENVTIDDPVPGGMTFVSASQECQLNGATVHCALGTIANGDNVSVTVTLRAGPSLHGQTITNLASVTSTTADPVQGNNNDSAAITVGERVDLHLLKTVSPASVLAGQNATYTLTVTNSGPSDATGVTLTDPLQPDITFISATASQGNCSQASGTVTCNLGTIAPGGQAQVQITVRAETAAAGQTLNNTASVSSNEPEARTGDNTAGAVLGVNAAPSPPAPAASKANLSLRKTTKVRNTRPTAVVPYRITVTNTGSVAAKKVTVCDQLPAEQRALTAPGAASKATRKVCWKIKSLAAGAKRSFTINTQVRAKAPAGSERNNALAGASNVDGKRRAAATVRVSPITGPCPSLRQRGDIHRYC